MTKKLKIELEDWDHNCADGCCYSWGNTIKVNGVEVDGDCGAVHDALENVLKHLGYDVEIVTK